MACAEKTALAKADEANALNARYRREPAIPDRALYVVVRGSSRPRQGHLTVESSVGLLDQCFPRGSGRFRLGLWRWV